MIKAQKILIIQTAFLGDAILSIPLLKHIRFFFPESSIGFVCRGGFGDFFLKAKLVDTVIELNKRDPKSLTQGFRQMKSFGADLLVSPHRSFRTALWCFRLRAKESVGFRFPWGFLAYKKTIRYPKEKHDVLRQLSLLEPLGCKPDGIPRVQVSLKVDLGQDSGGEELKDFIALSPGSQWETKRWTTEGFIKVGQKLSQDGKQIVILGSHQERSLGEDIAGQIPNSVNLCGKTNIVELAWILKRASLLVCNDSGTMHVASAMGTPVVTLFGPTVPAQGYAPWTDRARIVEVNLPCRPCGAHGHQKCPIGTHACMKNISAEEVIRISKELVP